LAKTKYGFLDTVTDYINDTRTLLQDVVAPFRYDDPSLLVSLNVTLYEARRLRPDLFIYNEEPEDRFPSFSANSSQVVKLDPEFRLAVVYGMVAHALMRDQEDIEDSRASTFMAAFNSILIGRGSAAIITPPGRSGATAPPAPAGGPAMPGR
jgi:hypothetical protein